MLDGVEGREAVRALDCRPEEVLLGRGPYTVEQNLELLRQIRAEVLATKDSGKEGGIVEKIKAARLAGCKLVVVMRPEEQADAVGTIEDLIEQLPARLPRT